MVVREMAGPIGIPDLTALVGDRSVLEARLALDVPPLLNQLDAGIVAAASARVPRSSSVIAESLGWPMDTILRRLPGLLRRGALVSTRLDRFIRPAALIPTGRLYAIEAKVRDRGAAIHQARTYGVWADGYVLVMGALSPRSTQLLLQDVDADRGGLMVDGRWLRRPAMGSLGPGRRLWAAEHVVAATRGVSYQPSVRP